MEFHAACRPRTLTAAVALWGRCTFARPTVVKGNPTGLGDRPSVPKMALDLEEENFSEGELQATMDTSMAQAPSLLAELKTLNIDSYLSSQWLS